MPVRSERIEVPGNRNLSPSDRQNRIDSYYRPFEAAVRAKIKALTAPIIITIHSFTPIYHGRKRPLELGILHDSDPRLADAMLQTAATHTDLKVARNEPYGPSDGVTHTLREHALPANHLNVMLEIRNDLIRNENQQKDMAALLSKWIAHAVSTLSPIKVAQ